MQPLGAVEELVWNSLDADATEVRVDLECDDLRVLAIGSHACWTSVSDGPDGPDGPDGRSKVLVRFQDSG
ncbi:hypothetical protein [Streptomyces sp. NPDC059949]|uniref:hypothetical protein n=1 Tax=Streptomyces sp. NPDC059949 TaxID=3347013 RepID=UPI003669DFB3